MTLTFQALAMWSDTGASITPSPAYGRELNSLFLEIIDDYGLELLVYQPTRQGNILDIILTSDPDMITNVDIAPGISDHEVICFDITMQSGVYLTGWLIHCPYTIRETSTVLSKDMCAFKDSYKSSNPECNSVDANWNFFKEALANSISRCIPKKKIKGPGIRRNRYHLILPCDSCGLPSTHQRLILLRIQSPVMMLSKANSQK